METVVIDGVRMNDILRHPLRIIYKCIGLITQFEENFNFNTDQQNSRRCIGNQLLSDLDNQTLVLELQSLFNHDPEHQFHARTLNMAISEAIQLDMFASEYEYKTIPEIFRKINL